MARSRRDATMFDRHRTLDQGEGATCSAGRARSRRAARRGYNHQGELKIISRASDPRPANGARTTARWRGIPVYTSTARPMLLTVRDGERGLRPSAFIAITGRCDEPVDSGALQENTHYQAISLDRKGDQEAESSRRRASRTGQFCRKRSSSPAQAAPARSTSTSVRLWIRTRRRGAEPEERSRC